MVLPWGGKKICYNGTKLSIAWTRSPRNEIPALPIVGLFLPFKAISSHLYYSASPQECLLLPWGTFLWFAAPANREMLQRILAWGRGARGSCRTTRSSEGLGHPF